MQLCEEKKKAKNPNNNIKNKTNVRVKTNQNQNHKIEGDLEVWLSGRALAEKPPVKGSGCGSVAVFAWHSAVWVQPQPHPNQELFVFDKKQHEHRHSEDPYR